MSKYERFDGGAEGSVEEGVNTKATQLYGATETPAAGGDPEAPAEPNKKKRW